MVCLYQQLTRAIESKESYAADRTFIFECAKTIFKEAISLRDAIDTIILMGWRNFLYSESQILFVFHIEQERTMERRNRTILAFDNLLFLMAENASSY